MKPSEIRPGETYRNGRGAQRTVIRLRVAEFLSDVVDWEAPTKSGWTRVDSSHLAAFARWARGRVER